MTGESDSAESAKRNPRECEHCGAAYHLWPWECPFDLHGEEDSFKTSCAVCETEIPSGASRIGGRFGNLYCSEGCALEGQDELFDIAMDLQREVKAVA